MVLDESGYGMKVVLDESGFGMKVVLDESGLGMKVVLDESGFGMKVVLDEKFWDEKRYFHPNLDESVPNPRFLKFRNTWSAMVCYCISEDCMGVAYCLQCLAL